MPEKMKVGLVLSGGGAKGAYQVGVLKALQELGTTIDVIAGASIGALNGAVLVSAPSISEGIKRLEELWLTLAETSPLGLNHASYINLLASAGLHLNGVGYIDQLRKGAQNISKRYGFDLPAPFREIDSGLISSKPLHDLLEQYLDPIGLAKGLPFFVSVFKSQGGLNDLLRTITAEIGIRDTPESEFLHIQSLPENEQKEVLLASAAIPILFAPKNVNGEQYTDGGQGGWQKSQGNTPITPLLKAGCNLVLVTHLSDGSLWSRHDFPETTILEIRPQSSISRGTGTLGGMKDLLGFDQEKIPSWIEQGYQDTLHCVGRVMNASQARNALSLSERHLEHSEQQNAAADSALADAMARLR